MSDILLELSPAIYGVIKGWEEMIFYLHLHNLHFKY